MAKLEELFYIIMNNNHNV